jgi:hypothetical protein
MTGIQLLGDSAGVNQSHYDEELLHVEYTQY